MNLNLYTFLSPDIYVYIYFLSPFINIYFRDRVLSGKNEEIAVTAATEERGIEGGRGRPILAHDVATMTKTRILPAVTIVLGNARIDIPVDEMKGNGIEKEVIGDVNTGAMMTGHRGVIETFLMTDLVAAEVEIGETHTAEGIVGGARALQPRRENQHQI